MRITIAKKLAGLVGVGVISTVLVGSAALLSINSLTKGTGDVAQTAQLVRNHMQGDMMHDALRGDVLSALLAVEKNDAEAIGPILNDVAEHAESFRSAMAENESLSTDVEVTAAIQEVRPLLVAYIDGAEYIVTNAFDVNVDLTETISDFERRFEALEPAMEGVADIISSRAVTAQDRAQQTSRIAFWAVLSLLTISVLVAFWVARIVIQKINSPLK